MQYSCHTQEHHLQNMQAFEQQSRKRRADSNSRPSKKRRVATAGKERQRLQAFNQALDSLQGVIPIRLTQNRKLHKKQTIQLAIKYINFLRDCMDGKRDWEDRNRFWCRSEDQLVIGAMDAAGAQSTTTSASKSPSDLPNKHLDQKINIENEQFQRFGEPQYYQISSNNCTSLHNQQNFTNQQSFYQQPYFEYQNIAHEQHSDLPEQSANQLGYNYSDEDQSPVQTILPVDVSTFFHQFDPTLKQEFVFPQIETTAHIPTENIVESRDENLDQAFADLEEIMTSPEHNNFSPESGFISTSPINSPEFSMISGCI